jgi:hypothetical protein
VVTPIPANRAGMSGQHVVSSGPRAAGVGDFPTDIVDGRSTSMEVAGGLWEAD